MLIKLRMTERTVVVKMAMTGISVLPSTWQRCYSCCKGDCEVELGTLLIYLLGKPRSRANDHNILDAAAMIPISTLSPTRSTKPTITALPPTDFVACLKISMNGYVKLVLRTTLGSLIQKRRAITAPRPITPFIISP